MSEDVPVGEEESGGVQGLRAWAADAAERVKRLVPGTGQGVPPPRAYEASVAELDQLARLLDHDPALHGAGLRGSVRVWLAGALVLRHVTGGGEPADRERAEALLREVRDRTTPLGAAVAEEDRRWAALFLLTHLSPIQPQRGVPGGPPDLSGYLDWVTRVGRTGMTAVALEIRTLMAEVVLLPLPPEFLAQVRQLADVLAAPGGSGLRDLVAGMVRAGSPFAERPRQTVGGTYEGAGECTGAHPDPTEPSSRNQEPEPVPDPVPEAVSEPEPVPDPVAEPKPKLTLDELRHLATALDAVHATTHGLDGLLSSGDPQALNDMLSRLRAVQDLPLPGEDPTPGLEGLRALLLSVSPAVGGTLQDRSAGHAHVAAGVDYLEKAGGRLPPEWGDPTTPVRALGLLGRVMEAGEQEDVRALRDLVAEAEAFERTVPEGTPLRYVADWTLGAAYLRLGTVTGDRETLLRGLPLAEKGMAGAKGSGLPFADRLPLSQMPDLDLLRAALTGEAAPATDHVPPPPDASPDALYHATMDLSLRFGLDHDPAVLATLIEELERLREHVRAGRAPRGRGPRAVAVGRRLPGAPGPQRGERDTASVDAAKEALVALAADVLLQTGAEHGLLTARTGASRGIAAARWALGQGRVQDAVTVLELGRALVLQAASTSAAVPELLRAAGRADLAEEWRAAGGSPDAGDGDQGEAAGVPDALPSTLRRQALDALGYRAEGGLLTTPTLVELSDGLAEAGADALVYLIPGEGELPGAVITVAPELGVGVGALPLLSGGGSGPLEQYLDATASRADRPDDPAAQQAWEDALGGLCDWAHQTLGPVLGHIRERVTAAGERDAEPLRVVLVPCGRLGLVPWHAARFPVEGSHDYLCKTVVISYAASGSQFLRTVRRAPRDPEAAPVLLADPSMTLTHAELEVLALRRAFYPRARLCGELYEVPPEELTPGTPDDVLTLLADGASLLHVASHGSAGTSPTVSALHLAPDEKGGEGALTVSRLLDGTTQREAPEGPLVVLSACETDLSTRDHDEALTLTTAFVSGGARDVVGSRWRVEDSASALLMAVFHHFLAVDGLSPVDALRAAQLWMLDPHRENPGSLDGELLREAQRPELDRIALWAAFIHQGHPGRGEDRTGDRTEAGTPARTEAGTAARTEAGEREA